MSEWNEVERQDDVELSGDGKTIDVYVKSDDNGSVYACIPIEFIRAVLPSPWRDVREELPSEYGEYLVYFGIANNWYSQQAVLYFNAGEEQLWHMRGVIEPTHWMPLPAPPAGEEG